MANYEDDETPINDDALAELDDHRIQRLPPSALAALNKSDVEAQLDAAHQHPRSIKRFLSEATTLATLNMEVAESCIYSVPRSGKQITGPSVRLAEICLHAFGNMHAGARVMDAEEKQIAAQGVAWDLEKNVRVTMEVRRSIAGKNGRRFNDDMINTTGNAAASIAFRNAVFRVIPKTYVNQVYQQCRRVAVGDAKTLGDRRQQIIERINKSGVTTDRVLARLSKASVEDIGLDDLETLIGIGTSVRNGDVTLDDAFPPVATTVPATTAEEGKRISIKNKKDEPQAQPAASDTGAVRAPSGPAERVVREAAHPVEAEGVAEGIAAAIENLIDVATTLIDLQAAGTNLEKSRKKLGAHYDVLKQKYQTKWAQIAGQGA